MKKELQDKLFEKYPKIFVQRKLPMTETCMCWGVDCGDGWFWLIDMLCSQLQWDIDKNGHPQIEAVQVKEKFGSLRFYVNGEDDTQHGMIRLAEYMSEYICEKCGATAGVTQTEGWIVTLCPKCMAERKKNHFKDVLPNKGKNTMFGYMTGNGFKD